MRTRVPLPVRVCVHVTMVLRPLAASLPDAFQLWESRRLGSITKTSQSVTPFQRGIGVARSAFGVSLEPVQDLRPTLMAGARAFSGETRMRQAHRRDPVLFVKIEPHLRLGRFFVPGR